MSLHMNCATTLFSLRTDTHGGLAHGGPGSGQFLTSIPSIVAACHTDHYQRELASVTSDLNNIQRNYSAKHKHCKIHVCTLLVFGVWFSLVDFMNKSQLLLFHKTYLTSNIEGR